MRGGDLNGISNDHHGGLLDRIVVQQRSTHGALSPSGNEATQRTLQEGGLTMTNQALAWITLVILAFALILTNHLLLSVIAIIPLILASFGDTKKAQRNR